LKKTLLFFTLIWVKKYPLFFNLASWLIRVEHALQLDSIGCRWCALAVTRT